MKSKIISLLLTIITVLASISIVWFAAKYDPIKGDAVDSFLGFSLYAVYAIMFIAFIALIGFAIWTVITNFEHSKASLVGVGVVIVVFLISYLLSSPTNSTVEQKFAVTSGLSKLIGGGLVATYIFMFGAILAAVWSSISNRLK